MKGYFILYISIIFLASCIHLQQIDKNDWYPDIVLQKNLQIQYDTAVIEMYRINTCCRCNCYAVNISSPKREKVNLLELDIMLETVNYYQDTVSFVFSFFRKNEIGNKDIYYPVDNGIITECMYNGISFKGKSLKPFPLSLGDIDILVPFSFHDEALANFNNCLMQNKISTTLKHFNLQKN